MDIRGMRALVAAALALAALPLAAGPATATHTEPLEPNGGQLVDECHGSSPSPGMCRQLEQLTRLGAQACRFGRSATPVDDPGDACSAVDGRAYSPAAMAHYEDSWIHRALSLQAHLDDGVPLHEALFPGTHNSFNSAAYQPTLSGLDHNNVATLTDQLRMDMRSVELDLHWFPSPHGDPEDGFRAPILCHGTSQPIGPVTVHIGCTGERHMRDGLAEVASWVDANPGEVVLLYLENQLDGDPAAHDEAAEAIEAELGERVHRPAGGQCDDMPTGLPEDDILPKQVLIVGNCGAGGAWGTWVHDRGIPNGVWDESKSESDDDFVCPAGGYGSTFQRFFEDSTWLGATFEPTGIAGPGEITVDETRAMVACGVNLFGFDQLVPADPRLAALVWSWAENEPSAGKVAYRDAGGRFRSAKGSKRSGAERPGETARRYACRTGGGWAVTAASGPWADGEAACDAEFGAGADFDVPATALDNAALSAAAGTGEVWLDYAKRRGTWRPVD